MKISRLPANTIMVRFNKGVIESRTQTQLVFKNRYVDALRTALDAIKWGFTNVEVIQRRERLHTWDELTEAAFILNSKATDDEVLAFLPPPAHVEFRLKIAA
jgi:hypothetical protein